jgi:hypothetical protein
MDTFSMRGAWAFGFRLFAHRPWLHALVLIGLGIVLPFALQFALAGDVLGMTSPAMLGQNRLTDGAGAGAMRTIALLLTYVLQLVSYFMSWRLGFGRERPLGGTIVFGLLASLLAMAVFAVIGAPAIWGAQAAAASGIPFLGLLAALIPLVTVFAMFYTLPAAMMATIASIILALSMIFSAVTGNVGMAATLIGGGSGAVVVLFLVMSVALMWLATRFSCTTSVMADWKTYNLLAALRESWRLTLEDQWIIMRYLVLVAFALALVIIAGAVIAGMGATAFLRGNPDALDQAAGAVGQAGAILLALAIGTPLAFLTVLVPAGIYRELTRHSLAAEVFA